MEVCPDAPHPLGASSTGGVTLVLFSLHDTDVSHCRFDSPDPNQLYGCRVNGPCKPQQGREVYLNRVVMDPYAMPAGAVAAEA